jgi:hypothetical protein
MAYGGAKVYFDGSHYIAIPHTTRPTKQRYSLVEEEVIVGTERNEDKKESTLSIGEGVPFGMEEINIDEIEDIAELFKDSPLPALKQNRRTTRKELFEEWYLECIDLSRREKRRILIEKMRPYFDSDEKAEKYVEMHLVRKQRNLICRRTRLSRKANLQEFNYFCTFTYDGKLHTEDSFRYKLKHTLSNFSKRKGWKYIGVWERSPEKKRLHFHGIFYIPEGTMPGKFIEVEGYNFNMHRRQVTNQSIYFNERFGRSDFEPLDDPRRMGDAMAYLMKYIEKSGEKIVYSKGLPQYFISDILDDDVVCHIGMEEQKLLLFDDFTCWDEGCYVGEVSSEVIKQMRKCN